MVVLAAFDFTEHVLPSVLFIITPKYKQGKKNWQRKAKTYLSITNYNPVQNLNFIA